ncbi:MAG: hypothetical protein KGJ78_14175 [Alphaproteobacteria bacterium]|nr:hypothetical protein [Alphaproteobacteria bacterium]
MPTARERLSHLLALAAEGPGRRAALAGEVAELVLDWPADGPEAMRGPLMALLELTVREADWETRARLAARMGGHPELPLHLINDFYLAGPPRVRREILLRNEIADEPPQAVNPPDCQALVAAARANAPGFAATLGACFAISNETALAILNDPSGEPFAALCKGAHADRATFSTIMVLHGAGAAALPVFDTVPQRAAERLVAHWRRQAPHHVAAAAE